MSLQVCISANTIRYPQVGGHWWVYLNWALGLRSLGCRVAWLEAVDGRRPETEIESNIAELRSRLERYGLADRLMFQSSDDCPLPAAIAAKGLPVAALREMDLLLNLNYSTPPDVVA